MGMIVLSFNSSVSFVPHVKQLIENRLFSTNSGETTEGGVPELSENLTSNEIKVSSKNKKYHAKRDGKLDRKRVEHNKEKMNIVNPGISKLYSNLHLGLPRPIDITYMSRPVILQCNMLYNYCVQFITQLENILPVTLSGNLGLKAIDLFNYYYTIIKIRCGIVNESIPKHTRKTYQQLYVDELIRLILSSIGIINRREEAFVLHPVFVEIMCFADGDFKHIPETLTIPQLLEISNRLNQANKIFPMVSALPTNVEGVPEVMLASIKNGQVISPTKSSLV
jgi:hypothetical protein